MSQGESLLKELTPAYLQNTLKHMSPSQINAISTCPFKWAADKLHKIPEVPGRKSQNLAIGNYLHDATGLAAKQGKEKHFNRDQMIHDMEQLVPETKALLKEEYSIVVDFFLDTYGKLDFNNNNTEVYAHKNIPGTKYNLPCLGYIDHIQDKNNVKTLCDLKIKGIVEKDRDGNVIYGNNEFIQMGMYAYMTGIRKTKLYIMHMKKNKTEKVVLHTPEITYTDDQIAQVIDRAIMVSYLMFSANYIPNRNCNWCNPMMCGYWSVCHSLWG